MDCQNKNSRELFIRSYFACALWSSTDESTPSGGEPFDKNYDAGDIATEAKAKMEADCNAFMDSNAEALQDYPASDAGQDFFLTRGHAGAGFWENDFGTADQCKQLTANAHACGECNLYLGDDGKIHVS